MIINKNKILSAHQPNFLPWFGFFEKIMKSDVFVFSDDVLFVKQQLTNRTYLINTRNEEFFVTLPINRSKGTRIYEKYISEDHKLINKSINKILSNYKNSKFYDEIRLICRKIIDDYENTLSLGQINVNTIVYICNKLKISSKFYLGSNMNLQSYNKNERLLKRAQKLGIMTYLHGKGADGYQDNAYLVQNGMKLIEVNYNITKTIFEEEYKLSIIHHIAKLGFQEITNRINKCDINYIN